VGYFRLKAGSHAAGIGATLRFFDHKDPKNNIVKSEEDLAATMPEKFEDYSGPIPEHVRRDVPFFEIASPGPPSDMARASASLSGPMTNEEKKSKAEELRALAEQLEKEAESAEEGEESAEEATTHRREKAAKSDSAERFENAGDVMVKRKMKDAERSRKYHEKVQQQALEAERRANASVVTAGRIPPEETEEDKVKETDGDGLDEMTVADLKSTAESEGVEIKSDAKKSQIVKAIRKKRDEATSEE
jgi:hypothetical protein